MYLLAESPHRLLWLAVILALLLTGVQSVYNLFSQSKVCGYSTPHVRSKDLGINSRLSEHLKAESRDKSQGV